MAFFERKYFLWVRRRKGGRAIPIPVDLGHEVTFEPDNSPAYVEGHVDDILKEVQMVRLLKKLPRFREGERIPTPQDAVTESVFGIPYRAYQRMSEAVWLRHKHLSRKRRDRKYAIVRSAAGFDFQWAWDPDQGFRVERLT